MRSALLLLLGLFWAAFLSAQSIEMPLYFGQFFNDPQINGIALSENDDLAVRLAHRRNGQQFSGVSSSLLDVQGKLKSKNDRGFHEVGLRLFADREGFLIRRNRWGGTYARHLPLNASMTLAAQVYAGAYNFVIRSNDVTGGLSNYTFDGALSLLLYHEKWRIGFNINQATNATLRPLAEEVRLPRHVNLTGEYSLELMEQLKAIPAAYLRYAPNQPLGYPKLSATGSLRLLWVNKLLTGMSLESQSGANWFIGIENLAVSSSNLGLYFSYFTPNKRFLGGNVQRYEVFLSYRLKSKK